MFYHYELFNIATILFKIWVATPSGVSKIDDEKKKRREKKSEMGREFPSWFPCGSSNPEPVCSAYGTNLKCETIRIAWKTIGRQKIGKHSFSLLTKLFLCSPFLQKLGIMSRNIQIYALKCIMLLNHLFAQRHRVKTFPFLSVVVIPSLPFPPYGD